jgi:hypothetical protein
MRKEEPVEVPEPVSEPEGWTLTKDGRLVKGKTGYLIDENDNYILQDGRRITKEIIIRDGARYCIQAGDKDPAKGLEKILGQKYDGNIDKINNLRVIDLFNNYHDKLPDVVYQAFQLNLLFENREIRIDDRFQFTKYGVDEKEYPLMSTRVGRADAKYKIIVTGPHGDERVALRLILKAQRYFTENRQALNGNTSYYFIPCMLPVFHFADARGLPIVDNTGKSYGANTETSIKHAKDNLDIPALHDLIATTIKISGEDVTLRRAIQAYNRTPDDPRYGIDTNRDSKHKIESLNEFYKYIDGLNRSSECIAVVFIHGYVNTENASRYGREGVVFPQYYIDSNDNNKVDIYKGRKEFSKKIRKTLGWSETQLIQQDNVALPVELYLYSDTQNNPNNYKGETIRELAEKRIYAFEIELPSGYDEGKRQIVSNKEISNYDFQGSLNNLIGDNFHTKFFAFLKDGMIIEEAGKKEWLFQ